MIRISRGGLRVAMVCIIAKLLVLCPVSGSQGAAQSGASQQVGVTVGDSSGPASGDALSHPFRDWLVFGQFVVESPTKPLDGLPRPSFEALERAQRLGQIENILSANECAGIERQWSSAYWPQHILDLHDALHRPCLINEPATFAYAATVIRSEREEIAYFSFGSNDGAKVWVNGELLFSNNNPRILSAYDHCVTINLKKGENLILAKVWRRGPFWKIAAALSRTAHEALLLALEEQGRLEALLLEEHFVPPGGKPRLDIRGAPRGIFVSTEIVDRHGTQFFRGDVKNGENVAIDTSNLREGLYRIRVLVDGAMYSETFYIGSAKEAFDRAALRNPDGVASEAKTFGILRARGEALLKPENRKLSGDAKREWERKFLHGCADLEQIGDGQPLLTGLHFHGFESGIDQSVQSYRLFVPRHKPGDELPIVAIVPPVVLANRPFHLSAFAANHAEAEQISKIADKYGLAVVWIGYRSALYGMPLELTHFDEVLADVSRRVRLDQKRIYLAALCGAGPTASTLATNRGDTFAAIGLLHPEFHRPLPLDGIGRGIFERLPNYKKASANADPFARLVNERLLPKLIIYDGAPKGHGDIEHSTEFVKAASDHPNLEFVKDPQSIGDNMQSWDHLFSWMSQQRATAAPHFNFNEGKTEGLPNCVSALFARRLTVIVGTRGGQNDTTINRSLARALSEKWGELCYGTLRIVDDQNFHDDQTANSNLLLIGGPDKNSQWKLFSRRFGLSLSRDKVQFESQVYEGLNLAICCAFNDTAVDHRLVGFIGSAGDIPCDPLIATNPIVNGWYRISVWEQSKTKVQLLDAVK